MSFISTLLAPITDNIVVDGTALTGYISGNFSLIDTINTAKNDFGSYLLLYNLPFICSS